MRAVVAALLIASFLAGCTDGGEDPPRITAADDPEGPGDQDDGALPTPRPTRDGNETSGAENGSQQPNRAPKILAFEPNRTAAEVPWNVSLRLDATDADDDALTWTVLLAGEIVDEGDALPATSVHSIETVGNHTFMLEVHDGNATTTLNVTVQGLAAQEMPEEPAGFEPWTFSGTTLLPCLQCPAAYNVCVGLNAGQSGLDCVFSELPEGAAGRTVFLEGRDAGVSFKSWCRPGDATVATLISNTAGGVWPLARAVERLLWP